MDELGVFRRLGVSTRSAVTGIVAGVAGTGALGASLIVDWQHLKLSSRGGSNDPGFTVTFRQDLTAGLAHLPYADVYVIGVLALLTVLGTSVARPDRARWLRFVAAALGLGVAGLVMVMIFHGEAALSSLYLSDSTFDVHEQIAAGGYWALGAVAVLVVGVWLTAGPVPAVPAATPGAPAVPTQAPPGTPTPAPARTAGRVGYLDGLTVTTSEPIDIGAGTDVLRT